MDLRAFWNEETQQGQLSEGGSSAETQYVQSPLVMDKSCSVKMWLKQCVFYSICSSTPDCQMGPNPRWYGQIPTGQIEETIFPLFPTL